MGEWWNTSLDCFIAQLCLCTSLTDADKLCEYILIFPLQLPQVSAEHKCTIIAISKYNQTNQPNQPGLQLSLQVHMYNQHLWTFWLMKLVSLKWPYYFYMHTSGQMLRTILESILHALHGPCMCDGMRLKKSSSYLLCYFHEVLRDMLLAIKYIVASIAKLSLTYFTLQNFYNWNFISIIFIAMATANKFLLLIFSNL